MLKNIRYESHQPNNGTGENFANELNINFTTSSLDLLDQSSSYISTTIQLDHRTYNGTTNAWEDSILPAGWGITNSPSSVLYSRAVHRIMERQVGALDDYAHSTLYNDVMTQSAQKLVNNNSSNPIFMVKRFSDLNATIINVRDNNKNSLGVLSKAKNIFSVCSKMPLFMGNNDIPGNLQHQISLHVAPSYEKGLLFYVTDPVVALDAKFKGIVKQGDIEPTGTANNDTYIRVNVLEVRYNVMLYEGLSIPSGIYSFMYNNYKTMNLTLANVKEQFTVDVPLNATDVGIFFMPQDTYSSYYSSLNTFANPLTSANYLLQSYRIKHNGNSYPETNLRLDLKNVSSNRLDNTRAFEEFIGLTKDLTPNGSAFDYVSYASNFIIYHRLEKISNDRSNKLEIQLEFESAPVLSRMVVIYKTANKLTLEYDNGTCVNVNAQKIN